MQVDRVFYSEKSAKTLGYGHNLLKLL